MKKIDKLYAASALMILAGCAQQGNPGGGEGDVVPPRFLNSLPASGSLNVRNTQKITIQFNEWVDPATVQKAVTIHPVVAGGFTIKTDTRKIEITPKDSFAQNTTYHISINGELTDFFKNRLKEPVSLVFSTGKTIDNGTVYGGVATGPEKSTTPLKAALFLGIRIDKGMDTVLLGEPDYLVQCDSLDRFNFSNINENNYSIIAFRDNNSDNRVTPGEPVYITKSNRIGTGMVTDIILFPASSDTARWKISKIQQASPTVLSASVTPARLPDSVMIQSSDSKTKLFMRTSQLLSDSTSVLMFFDKPIPSGQYDLISWWPNRFTAGKIMPKNDTLPYRAVIADTIKFNAVPPSDTLKPKMVSWKAVGENSRSPILKLTWSLPVQFSASLIFTDTLGKQFPFELIRSPEREMQFKPKTELPFGQTFKLRFKPEEFTALHGAKGTSKDTVIAVKTADEKETALSILLNFPNCEQFKTWQWEIRTAADQPAIPLRLTADGLLAEQIPAGTYSISLFEDRNGNGKQDLGTLFPRSAGEPRLSLPDTVKAKARWRTELSLPSTCSLLKTAAPAADSTAKK